MAVIKVNSGDVDLLARLIRAEAEAEGELGMLMVGNVGVNRILSNCLDFKNIRSMRDMVFQSPGGYEAVQKSYFYQRARDREKRLARRTINGERTHPASNALWFSARRAIVPLPGIINRILAVIKLTASSYRRDKIVHVFSREQIVKGASSS